LTVNGTGFFVRPRYIITAGHVLKNCEDIIDALRRLKDVEAEIGVFFATWTESELKLNVLHSEREYGIAAFAEGYPGPGDLDVGLIIPREQGEYQEVKDIRHLEMKNKPFRPRLYDKMCICGFPGGAQSLQLQREYGMRFSPTLQFGHLTGLMPFDEIKNPYGIQTDIVATGGSSGSAIVDAEDGKVVGIAQKVFVADIAGQTNPQTLGNGILTLNPISLTGTAKVGLVYGASSNIFAQLPEIAKENYERNTPISMHPLEVSKLKFAYITHPASPSRT